MKEAVKHNKKRASGQRIGNARSKYIKKHARVWKGLDDADLQDGVSFSR
jgi:hypothetical protein|tara:strand:- start:4184 stop:4330 length:147 start_codon:yes stop_codon:yes gene_type:complete